MVALAESPRELALAGVLVALVFLLLVQSLRLWVASNRARWRLARHRVQGARGEQVAERLLVQSGYQILARQVGGGYELSVDGAPWPVTLRADFVVRRGSRRYVAEAKGGRLAARLETAATRRQLLEYSLAFDVEGVLLVDAEGERITLVQLPTAAHVGSQKSWAALLLIACLVAALLTWLAVARS